MKVCRFPIFKDRHTNYIRMIVPRLILLLLLVNGVAACDIDGSWSEGVYEANDTMKFEGTIEPHGGFVYGYIENPIDAIVAEIPTQQVDDDFEIKLHTNHSFLNGTYRARVWYVDYPNGSSCDASVTGTTILKTNNTAGDMSLDVEMRPGVGTFTKTFSPIGVEMFGHKVDATLTVAGYEALIPDISLNSVKIAPQTTPLTSADISITMCPSSEDIMLAYQRVGAFLASNQSNMTECNRRIVGWERDYQDLENLYINVTGYNSKGAHIRNGELDKAHNQLKDWQNIAGGKADWWLVIVLLVVAVVFTLIFKAHVLDKTPIDQPPPPI